MKNSNFGCRHELNVDKTFERALTASLRLLVVSSTHIAISFFEKFQN